MINGTIDELSYYLPEKIKDFVMGYIKSIDKDTEDGYTDIMSGRIYGKVMSYQTLPSQECKIEAHDKYIDIQASILGSEGITVYQRKDLNEMQKYDSENDVTFFRYEGKGHFADIDNIPGRFTMLLPEDAHQPQIKRNGSEGYVKKLVVKIDVSLLQ